MRLRHSTLFFTFVLITNLALAQSSEDSRRLISEIDEFLISEFENDKPGASVLISKEDSILYRKGFGLADFERATPIQPEMIFEIASMTKQFTAVAILQLVDKGEISFQDTLRKFIDYFPSKHHSITIEHLLTHTSGIPEFFDIDEDEYHLLVQKHTPSELIAYFQDEPLEFEPGSKFRYSNSNYVLLGAIIEKVSGQSYEQYLQDALFKPLGMNNTAMWYQDYFPEDQIPFGYMIKDGAFVPSTPIGGSVLYASGGIVSTVDDLFKWNRALKNNRLLSAKISEKMFSNYVLSNRKSSVYGYGFFIKDIQGHKTIQHGGNLYGFTSSGLWIVDKDLFVCILSNRGFARTEEIADYIASLLIGKPIEISQRQVIASQKLDDYVGSYKLDSKKSKIMNIIVVADRLVLTFPDQPGSEVDILPTDNEDSFESRKINAKLNFTRDDSRNVDGITIVQGKTYHWKRIK